MPVRFDASHSPYQSIGIDRQKSGGESLAASLLFSLGDSKEPLLLLAIEDVTE